MAHLILIHVIVFRQLEPDNYTDLILDEAQSSFYEELWDGEKVKLIFLTTSTEKLYCGFC